MNIIPFSRSKWGHRVLAVGCLAAIILLALLLVPEKDEPYEGELEIAVNATEPLHGKTRESVYGLRTELVSRHRVLGIFPESYIPSSAVYGQVTWGDDWVNDVQIYVNNPYLLVMTGAAGKVNPLLTFCGVESVNYKTGRIEVVYRGEQASRWFYYIYDYYKENNGIARLNFVNALDAGFRFAHVDGAMSVNVDTSRPVVPGAVTQGVYRTNEFFHVGHLKKNNKSPRDRKAWVRFKEKDAATRIHIKLWRERPSGPDAEEDLAYVISLEP
jgi:hypothetical protein